MNTISPPSTALARLWSPFTGCPRFTDAERILQAKRLALYWLAREDGEMARAIIRTARKARDAGRYAARESQRARVQVQAAASNKFRAERGMM